MAGQRFCTAVALSTALLVMTNISVAGAFSSQAPPTTTASCAGSGLPNMRRSAIHARLWWRNAIPSFRPSINLVRESIEEEDIQKEVLENAMESILYNKGLDRVVGSALHSIQPPHYEKLASALPSLSNLLPLTLARHRLIPQLTPERRSPEAPHNYLGVGSELLGWRSMVPLRRRDGTIELEADASICGGSAPAARSATPGITAHTGSVATRFSMLARSSAAAGSAAAMAWAVTPGRWRWG